MAPEGGDGFPRQSSGQLPIFADEDAGAVASPALPDEADVRPAPWPTERILEIRRVWSQRSMAQRQAAKVKRTTRSSVRQQRCVVQWVQTNSLIREREERDDAGSTQSTVKMDPQAPGWTKRIRVGSHPPDRRPRTPCPGRLGVLEQTI